MERNLKIDKTEAFADLMNESEKIFRLCLGFTKNPMEAEELTQEVYLRAFRHFSSLRDMKSIRSWFYRIASNTCLNHMKRRNRLRFLPFDKRNVPKDRHTPEKQFIMKEQRQRLKKAIWLLPVKQRRVFLLREYGHLSYEELAKILGIKIGTVMSRLNRARKAVLEALGDRHEQT